MFGDLFKGLKLDRESLGNSRGPRIFLCKNALNCNEKDPNLCTNFEPLFGEDIGYTPKSDYGFSDPRKPYRLGDLESGVGTGDYSSSVGDYLDLKKTSSTPGDYSKGSNRYDLPKSSNFGYGDGRGIKYMDTGNGGDGKYTDLSQAA